jgi:hypothetical protein
VYKFRALAGRLANPAIEREKHNFKNHKSKQMKKSYQDEIDRNGIVISYGGIAELLLSGPGITHIESRVIDEESEAAELGFGIADTYGVKSGNLSNGTFDCFFVTLNSRLWERENIMEVGILLRALEQEHADKALKAA